MQKGIIKALLLLTALAFGTAAFAQEQGEADSAASSTEAPANPPPNKKSSSEPERIEVTGSRIKRIDIEGPSPVLTLNREELDRSGYNSISDVLRDTTAANFGGAREAAGTAAADVATIGVHGLGDARTLVLLNGKRLPSDALAQAVDLNLIPMAAVERIEVLKDGASAIYGSDAIGGVINIITKKNFSGVDAFVKYSMPQEKGGEETEASIVGGKTGSKASVMVVGRYNHKAALMSRDRWWTNQGESVASNPGNYYVSGSAGLAADPNNACPSGYLRTDGADTYCAYPYAAVATEIPEISQYNGLIEANYKFSESLTLFARFIAVYKDISWQLAPTPISGLSVPGSSLNDAADNLPVAGGDTVSVYYRLTELGNREFNTTNLNYGTYVGAKGYIGATTWDWEATVGYNHDEKKEDGKNFVRTSTLESAIENNTYNPFASGNKGSINDALIDVYTDMESNLKSFDLQFTGEAFDMSSGAANAAFGLSTFTNDYEVSLDEDSANNDVIGSGGASGTGQRDVYSAFTEWSFPVLSSLELQAAARYDHYSDFGDTVNPKLAARYTPTSSVLIRGSVGTAFLAPSLDDLYKTSTFGFPSFKDEVGCEELGGSYCNAKQYSLITTSNRDLEEEKALTASLGALFQPNRDFHVGLDFWYVKMDNVVGLDLNSVTEAEKKFGQAYVEAQAPGLEIDRQANGALTEIRAPALNLQSRDVYGIDANLGYIVPGSLWGMRLGFNDEYGIILSYKQELFPGLGKEEIAGEGPAWRNNFSVLVKNEASELSATARTTSKVSKANGAEGQLPVYTEYDLNYALDFAWNGSLAAGVKNIFGSTPPIDETAGTGQGLYSSIYNPYGRVYYISYRQGFF
jgi:iron complex outermembrane receptor protein